METRRRVTGDAQQLVEKIVRLKIRESRYWKEHCFGLTAEKLVDKAVELNCIGGVANENNRPTPFLCLLFKMLGLAPAHSIVLEFIRNEQFKYVRCLGALYLRMVGLQEDVYMELEPLLADYRKISLHRRFDWELTTVDQFIDGLLTDNHCLEMSLPYLANRGSLIASRKLPDLPRESALREEFLALYEEQIQDKKNSNHSSKKSRMDEND